MSVRELWQDFKKLDDRLTKLEQGTHSIESIDKVLEEIDSLKNQYKMLNARISRKNNGKEDG
jgi:ubiquinone biosynthesis protein UbiJ